MGRVRARVVGVKMEDFFFAKKAVDVRRAVVVGRVSQICILRAANLQICESASLFFLAPAIHIFADSHMRADLQIQ